MNLDDRAAGAGAAARHAATRSDATAGTIIVHAQRRQRRRVAGMASAVVVVLGVAGMRWDAITPEVMLGPAPPSPEEASEVACTKAVPPPAPPTRSGWQRLSPPPLQIANDQSAVAVGSGHVVVATYGPTPQTAVLDVAARTWSCARGLELDDAVLREGDPVTLVGSDDAAFAWDGQHVARFDLATTAWVRLPDPPEPSDPERALRLTALTAAVTDSELLVWWGSTDPDDPVQGAAWHMDRRQWRRIPDAPMSIDVDGSVQPVWSGEELFLVGARLGGRLLRPLSPQPLLAIYDPVQNQWRRAASPGLSPHSFKAAWVSGRLVMWDYLKGAARYDAHADRWEPLKSPPFRPGECGAQPVVIGRSVFMKYCGQFGRWNSVDDTWETLRPPPEAPGGLLLVGNVLVTTTARTINYGGPTLLYQLPDGPAEVREAPQEDLPQRLVVTCTPDGPVADETQVQAVSGGVQVRFEHPKKGRSIGWEASDGSGGGEGTDADGSTDKTWPLPPGFGVVSCMPSEADAGDDKWSVRFTVVDPDGNWTDETLDCRFASNLSDGYGREVRREDAAAAVSERYPADATVVQAGYRDAREPSFVVVRNGRRIALIETLEGSTADTIVLDSVKECS